MIGYESLIEVFEKDHAEAVQFIKRRKPNSEGFVIVTSVITIG